MSPRTAPPRSPDVSPMVSMDMITKTFPGVKALDEVNLTFTPAK